MAISGKFGRRACLAASLLVSAVIVLAGSPTMAAACSQGVTPPPQVSQGEGYTITFTGRQQGTWTYHVAEQGDQDLRYWVLFLYPSALSQVSDISSGGFKFDPPESGGCGGIKWVLPPEFESGDFSFALNGAYGEVPVCLKVKVGTTGIFGKIAGPAPEPVTPVPELPTAALLGAGLALVCGYALFHRGRWGKGDSLASP